MLPDGHPKHVPISRGPRGTEKGGALALVLGKGPKPSGLKTSVIYRRIGGGLSHIFHKGEGNTSWDKGKKEKRELTFRRHVHLAFHRVHAHTNETERSPSGGSRANSRPNLRPIIFLIYLFLFRVLLPVYLMFILLFNSVLIYTIIAKPFILPLQLFDKL